MLTLEPNYDADTTDNVDASGCNINGDLDLGNNCDSAIVNDMIGDATNRVDMAVTTVAPPVEKSSKNI